MSKLPAILCARAKEDGDFGQVWVAEGATDESWVHASKQKLQHAVEVAAEISLVDEAADGIRWSREAVQAFLVELLDGFVAAVAVTGVGGDGECSSGRHLRGDSSQEGLCSGEADSLEEWLR